MSVFSGIKSILLTCAIACGVPQTSSAVAPDGVLDNIVDDSNVVAEPNWNNWVLLNPNILLIIADDIGVDKINAYGEGSGNLPETTNIDRIADNGLLFRNAWANPVCSPTRAGIFTGRHAFRTGVGTAIPHDGSDGNELGEENTLADVLDTVSYTSGVFGKWHLGETLTAVDHGFATHLGSLGGTPFNARGVADYFDYLYAIDGVEYDARLGNLGSNDYYATHETMVDAAGWIVDQENAGNNWVATVAFNAPHNPWHEPDSSVCSFSINPSLDQDIEMFNAMTECMDQKIGELFATIGDNVLEDTLVIFVGDNGTNGDVVQLPFNPDRAKGSVYEGGVNVPFLVANGYTLVNGTADTRLGPMQINNPGSEVDHLVHTVDLFASIADVAGADSSDYATGEDSVSFTSYFDDEDGESVRDHVYTERFTDDGLYYQAIRDEQYKFIKLVEADGTESTAFYDLDADTWEETNLLDDMDTMTADEAWQYIVLAATMWSKTSS